MIKRVFGVITAAVLSLPASAKCVSFKAVNGGTTIDFSVPGDYVDICSKDKELCRKLTSGYPPSTKTAGYFVKPDEWKMFQAKTSTGFKDYLIAQFAEGMRVEQWADFKKYVRSQNGSIQDHTKAPEMIKIKGEANLGVVQETNDDIIFGKIVRLHLANDINPTVVALNAAVKVKNKVLTLYAYGQPKDNNPAPTKELAKAWVSCIRQANKK